LVIRVAREALVMWIPRYIREIWEKNKSHSTESLRTWSLCTRIDRPVALAQMNIVRDAIRNLNPAAVKGPIPARLILIATALAPNAALRNAARAVERIGHSSS